MTTSATSNFNETLHPRAADGTFEVKPHDEPDTLALDPGTPPEDIFGLTPEEFMHQCEAAARARSRHVSYDPLTGGSVEAEDLSQEVMVRLLTARQKGRQPNNVAAFIQTVTSNEHTKQWNRFRAEDRAAISKFNKALDRFHAEHGRELSTTERKALAHEIRETWHDRKRRPTMEFIKWANDRGSESGGTGLAVPFSVTQPHDQGHRVGAEERWHASMQRLGDQDGAAVRKADPYSWCDQAEHAAEEGAAAGAGRRLMWNALGESEGLPEALPGQVSQNEVTRLRKVLVDDTTVRSAADAWLDGERDTDRVKALSVPFGDGDVDRVAEALTGQHSRRAYAMWLSALEFANNRHRDTSQAAYDAKRAAERG